MTSHTNSPPPPGGNSRPKSQAFPYLSSSESAHAVPSSHGTPPLAHTSQIVEIIGDITVGATAGRARSARRHRLNSELRQLTARCPPRDRQVLGGGRDGGGRGRKPAVTKTGARRRRVGCEVGRGRKVNGAGGGIMWGREDAL